MQKSILSFTLFFLLWLGTSPSFANSDANSDTPTKIRLSALLKSTSTGMKHEKLPSAQRLLLQKQAEEYIRMRRGRMGRQEKEKWMLQCASKPDENLFCRYSREKGPKAEVQSPRLGMDPFGLSSLLTQGDLKPIRAARESELIRALKLIPNWEPIQKIAEEALEEESCELLPAYVALGLKAEEYFPEKRFKDLAKKLYAEAAECGTGETAAKAIYRLSLLHIWDNECKDAQPFLTRLSELKESDYLARSLYWKAHCARQNQDVYMMSSSRERLSKEYPLSYHGMLLSQKIPQIETRDEIITFRSESRPELTPAVQAIEMLQTLKAPDLAGDLLNSLIENLGGTEESFRIYVAVLSGQGGDTLGQFRVLGSLFKDKPSLISRSTLELFYPLKRFDIIKRYQSKIDPYLVAALIRQESGFNAHARSVAGALGLMQLMPDTARRMERVSKRQLLDPSTNVRVGVKYFYSLLGKYEADAELALAAYNAGPEKVDDWKRRYPTDNRVLFLDLIPYRETREYVSLIARNYYWYKTLYEPKSVLKSTPKNATTPFFTLLNITDR